MEIASLHFCLWKTVWSDVGVGIQSLCNVAVALRWTPSMHIKQKSESRKLQKRLTAGPTLFLFPPSFRTSKVRANLRASFSWKFPLFVVILYSTDLICVLWINKQCLSVGRRHSVTWRERLCVVSGTCSLAFAHRQSRRPLEKRLLIRMSFLLYRSVGQQDRCRNVRQPKNTDVRCARHSSVSLRLQLWATRRNADEAESIIQLRWSSLATSLVQNRLIFGVPWFSSTWSRGNTRCDLLVPMESDRLSSDLKAFRRRVSCCELFRFWKMQ